MLALFLFSALPVEAHIPVLVEQNSLHDITQIVDPELSQAFYGTLTNGPHTFEIKSAEPFHLYVQVLVPDIEGVPNTISGIVIRETGFRGRVSEVARLLAEEATWESFFEVWGGDRYRKGSEFERDVESGVYRLEVSTPDNKSQYVLVVGKREDFNSLGYFETVKRIAEVKSFFGKSKLRVIESPLVYVPLCILMVFVIGYMVYRRKIRQEPMV